eukprot:TRINITY_DN13330_c0_g1_i1.p1 TRINITY_DN13330_c0_g1~~TRINITY_DN13330_c0_g1_i1.p1  ORF type:complete len:122 (+),score=12.75 TRINITY_DN13330_c0_g1_i1:252-617(+)
MANHNDVAKEELESARNATSQEVEEELVPPRSASALIQSVSQIASQTANSVRETVASASESVASVRHTMVMAKDSVMNHPLQDSQSLTHDPSGSAPPEFHVSFTTQMQFMLLDCGSLRGRS